MKFTLFLTLCGVAFGQTATINGVPGQRLTNIDKPVVTAYTVSTLPASPATGTTVPITDGNPTCGTGGGSAKIWCRYNGSSWDAVGDGGSGSSIPDDGLRVSAASGAVRLSTGSRRIGSATYTLSALCDATPSAGTGFIFWYMQADGTFKAGHNVTATITSGSCSISSGITTYPQGSMGLGYCAVTSGVVGTCTASPQTGRDTISSGDGIEVTGDAPQAIHYRGRLRYSSSTTVLTFGSDCSSSYPCVIGAAGSTVYPLTSSFTATISTGTGNLYVYVASDGTKTVAKTAASSINPSCSGCTVGADVSDFPNDSTPLYYCTATSSATWDSPACVDRRPTISRPGLNITCSTNMTCSQTQNTLTLSSSGGSAGSTILSSQGPLSNVTMTGGGTYDTLFTYTLTGGTLSSTGCVRILYAATNSGSVNYRFSWGSTNFDSNGVGTSTAARNEVIVCNAGTTSTQKILWPGTGGINYGTNQTAGTFNGYSAATEATGSNVTISWKASGTASDTVTPLFFLVIQL